jgi:ABC transporter fused permease/ATP-binding protein
MARFRRPHDTPDDDLPRASVNRATLTDAVQLFRYLWPYRLKFALALTALLFGGLVGLGFPVLAGKLVDGALAQQAGAAETDWTRNVNTIALLLICVLAIQGACAFLRVLWFTEVGERGLADLRRETFARLIHLPLSFHSERRVGELASRIAADLTRIRDTLIDALPNFLRQVVLLIGGVVLIAITSLKLTLVMLVSLPPLMVGAGLFGRLIRGVTRQVQDRLADSNVVVEEALQNISSVKAFTNESHEEGRYRDTLSEYVNAAVRGAWFEGGFVAFIVFALFGGVVLVLWYGTRLVLAHELTIGSLAQFMLLSLYIGGAFGTFAELYAQLQRALGATQRVRELLVETPESSAGVGPLERIQGDVVFENVSFRYPSRKETPVLVGASLHARPGERIALVGPSGAGKSTLVSLLLRFYDPESGRILIDGREIQSYNLHELRKQMAVVPQEVLLFGGTIADNIAYGKPGSSREEIEQAARLANAHDFIVAFPQGYETRVGERGVQLSGGQRQRVAIARALLRDPAILLLDEATSSLDSESERLVLQAMDRLMQGRTSLVIAHRLSTVRGSDRIFVLREGRTVESGTHAELMAHENGLYRTLTELQREGASGEALLAE